ncbi:MalM family protein [Salinivibrio sp. YCSC6]|uniref:MalM family protein n=1 Tax=Salinivibrio sp. YCSC6 TaxID=2003370 RepID=UPI000BBB8C22|nr:MalM family protein [Salinivibrio sp. YCSC6]PCE65677.1 hypothetical protein B6G00_17125 [Salinivibrio sp. YCSC6]QCF37871.1 hypothetical protein E8E00_16970 [Salinivibrio sp. YCSC6]
MTNIMRNYQRFKMALAVSSAVWLVGCASNLPEELLVAPNNREACCATFHQLPYVQLKERETLTVSLGPQSEVFSFLEGKSYTQAFRFNDRTARAQISVKSVMQHGRVFVPRVLLLDKHYQVIKTLGADMFTPQTANLLDSSQLSGSFDSEGARYMVMYTNATTLGHKITLPHPAKLRAQELGEPMPMVTDPTYRYAPTGQVSVTVVTKEYATVLSSDNTSVSDSVTPQGVKQPEAQKETVDFYNQAIAAAISEKDISKAMALLNEAKALKIEGADKIFIELIENQLNDAQ